MLTFYIEYASGYCTVVKAANRDLAIAYNKTSRVPGDWMTACREARDEDVEWFTRSGGTITESYEDEVI